MKNDRLKANPATLFALHMKPVWLILFFIGYLPVVAQQNSIRGLVSIHNSETETGRRQYVANAQVTDDFGKAQPTVTDANGQFSLIYVGLAEKSTVSFQVTKPGLAVVNIDALQAVAGQHEIVKISMASPDKIAEYRRRIYSVGKTEAEKRLEKLVVQNIAEINVLRINRSVNEEKIRRQEAKLAALEDQKKKIEIQAEELARRYAPINLDDASLLFRTAFGLFQAGLLDSSLVILTKANLSNMVSQIVAERNKIKQLKDEVQIRDSIQAQQTRDVKTSLRFKADLHTTRFEMDSAYKSYRLLMRLDSADFLTLYQFSYFLQLLNRNNEALPYYRKAIAIISQFNSNSIHKWSYLANLKQNLAILYTSVYDFEQAEVACKEALSIYIKISNENPSDYLPYLAWSHNSLGSLYAVEQKFDLAIYHSLEALAIYRELAKKDAPAFERKVAEVQNNLGNQYLAAGDLVCAEACTKEGCEIFLRLGEVDPGEYRPHIARTQNNLGNLYLDLNDTLKAEAAYLKSLNISKDLEKEHPLLFSLDVARALWNVGNIYAMRNDFASAEPAYIESLNRYEQVCEGDPQSYIVERLQLQVLIGANYRDLKRYKEADTFLLTAYSGIEAYLKLYPETFKKIYKSTLVNLVMLYRDIIDTLDNNLQRLIWQKKHLDVCAELYAVDPGEYKAVYAYSNGSMATLVLETQFFNAAERYARTALLIDSNEVWVKRVLAHALLFQDQYSGALKIYNELKSMKDESGKSFIKICLEDLESLERRGITHKDIEKVRSAFKN